MVPTWMARLVGCRFVHPKGLAFRILAETSVENTYIQALGISLNSVSRLSAKWCRERPRALRLSRGAEGATAPETLRQKDRHHLSIHSEECAAPSSAGIPKEQAITARMG